tara:strand:- start:14471 stop:15391 length:921 start_codon:yes stop_codon:yes gene_type:complete
MEVIGTVYKGPNQFGDFLWQINNKDYDDALFIFNEDEIRMKSTKASKGNSIIRPYNMYATNYPRSVGMLTGKKNKGYTKLDDYVKSKINMCMNHIKQIITTCGYTQVYYSAQEPNGLLATNIFVVDDEVIKYITEQIHSLQSFKPNYIYFSSPNEEEPYSGLSLYYYCQFIEDNVTYSSVLHYILANKAMIMTDLTLYNHILKLRNTIDLLELERSLKLDTTAQQKWHDTKYQIVKQANLLKFTQNSNLKALLLSTENNILVNTSPSDSTWGIAISTTQAKNGEKWNGQNLLGKILVDIRKIIAQC